MMNSNDPYIDRVRAAEEISASLFPVTPRSLRNWSDVPTILLEGKACAKRSTWLRAGEKRLADARHAPQADQTQRAERTERARTAALQARVRSRAFAVGA
jgi:hypothetical protein